MENRKQLSKQKAILIGFISSIFIFSVSVIFILNSIYPDIQFLEEKKLILKEDLNSFNTLNKKGFDYESFKKVNSKYSNTTDDNLKELLEGNFYKTIYPNINKSFYEKSIYFITDEEGNNKYYSYEDFKENNDFSEFLKEKGKILKIEKNSKEFINKKNKLKKVLPIYYALDDEKNGLTDLSFINFIERLLNKFNLKTTSQIGIKEVKQVEDNILDKNSLIYYIPLSLKISGTKESILNFLQYIRNSGDIEFNENNDFEFSDKVGATSQLAEVSSIKFQEYIDSSYKQRDNSDLLRYLYKTNQNEDIIDITLDLKFYVSTLSQKNLYEKINNIIGNSNKKLIAKKENNILAEKNVAEYQLLHYNYNNLLTIAKSLKSNSLVNKNVYYKQKAENIFKYLNSTNLKKQILALKKEMKTTKNIDNLYRKTLKYKEIFLKLDKEMYKIASDLGIEKDKKDENGKVISKSIYPKNYIFENK